MVAVILFSQVSCGNQADAEKEPENTTTAFFPVTDFILSQLQEIDSLQLPLTLYRSGVEAADTQAISTSTSREIAEPFTSTSLNDPEVAALFTESSFADQSTPSVNFTYTTKSSEIALRRVDVVLRPSSTGIDKVTSIYMEKQEQKGDTLIEEKLLWKTDHYYQILRTKTTGGTPQLSQIKVVWDPTE